MFSQNERKFKIHTLAFYNVENLFDNYKKIRNELSKYGANLLKKKNNCFVRFHWLENPKEIYFEFLIQVDEMTSDVSLIISDFAEDSEDKEEQLLLWEEQVNSLKRAIGS